MNDWLEKFEESRGRALRVLFVGNVANNAYYFARFLNRKGVHADVFAYDMYHIMATPEWEEANFSKLPGDHYFPDWWNIIPDYEQPHWFAQGPWELCVEYLTARVSGREDTADQVWKSLKSARQKTYSTRRIYRLARKYGKYIPEPYYSYIKKIVQSILENIIVRQRRPTQQLIETAHEIGNMGYESIPPRHFTQLINDFSRLFSDRPDKLTLSDIQLFGDKALSLSRLFNHYDIIHADATDAIYPLLCGFRPYVAFEHGTLRDLSDVSWAFKGPFFDNAIGRLTAFAFSSADHVFITNADTLPNVHRLNIKSFSPIGHPFDDNDCHEGVKYREDIRSGINSEMIFLCPIRHDWLEKGTDKYIRIIPKLQDIFGDRFKVCFMNWGKEVKRSRKLIKHLKCNDRVAWVGPFGRVEFNKWLTASDVIFDQISFPSFSGTTPRALACGVPVIVRYDEESMKWMFPERPPVLSAASEEDIIAQTVRAVDKDFLKEYRHKARDWVKKYHSAESMTDELLGVYEKVMHKGTI